MYKLQAQAFNLREKDATLTDRALVYFTASDRVAVYLAARFSLLASCSW